MTTIAYRGGVMAADSAAYICNQQVRAPGAVRKVRRLRDGSLFAGAGSAAHIARLADYLDEHGPMGLGMPTDPAWAVLVTPDGRIWSIQEGDCHVAEGAEFYATGSGSESALGAMHAGADARRAIEIAILVDPFTAGEVISMELGA